MHGASTRRSLPGLDVLEVVVSGGGALADRLEASRWLHHPARRTTAGGAGAVEKFLAADEVLVERMTKRGLREFDCRAAVVSLVAAGRTDECAILDVVLRHGTPAVRPDDILAGLRLTAGLPGTAAALYQRLAQGPLDERDRHGGRPVGARPRRGVTGGDSSGSPR